MKSGAERKHLTINSRGSHDISGSGSGGGSGGSGNSAAVVALGLVVTDTSPRTGNAPEGFPVVASVAAGGAAESAGVVEGAAIVKVEELSMHQKPPAEVSKAMYNSLKAEDNESAVRVVTIASPWPAPPPPPGGAGGTGGAVNGGGCWDRHFVGGMACLGREEQRRGREFVEMCWSILMCPEGGVPLASDGGGQSMEERPAEQDEEVMRRLGFDVERRDVSEGLECIEVLSVEPTGVAATHGLQTKDLILAVDGKHLLSTSESSFWLEVGRALRACDSTRRNNGTADAAATAIASALDSATGLPTGYGEDKWLRFLVVRKGNAPAARPPTVFSNGSAASEEKAARRAGRARAPGPPEIDWRTVRKYQESPSTAAAAAALAAGTGVATASRTATSTAKLGTAGGSPGGKGRKRGPKPRGDGDDKQKRLDARKRPGWWEPYVKGSHRTVLSLRPADALPGAVRGGPVAPGAYVLVDTKMGDKLTIPAGAKLTFVDEKPVEHLRFKDARDVALSAGKNSVLKFE